MAASSSSCSPSSSAVTIPTPGKSILKRPPPAQSSFFTRIKGFLPNQVPPSSADDESKPLKQAHFILTSIATVYPISSMNPPSTPTLKDEKRAIEEREAERRKRIVRGNSAGPDEPEEWWTLDKVESFYRECCASREEEPDPAISATFKRAAGTTPRCVDLSGVLLTANSSAPLADVLTIEWGLRKLVLRECDLDEHMLKPLLHALLIPGALSFLSLASNRRLKAQAFRILSAYVARARSLQFLDLSQNNLDKKSVEYITNSLTQAPEPGLVSLRLDDCSLRPTALEVLSRGVRTSSLRNISLRHNRITATGAVALALMIRDYPDIVPSTATLPTLPNGAMSPPTSPMSPGSPFSPPDSPSLHSGSSLPPPRHPAVGGPQTTYTPYIPRARRAPLVSNNFNPLSASGQPVPIITSNSQGGVTTRHPVPPSPFHAPDDRSRSGSGGRHDHGPSAALLDKVRALDNLPRLGALRTLDLKGNDIRNGVTYIAQVLKRNRTLKVLNLSENKLDVQCLVAVAEALKYNSCLETLDLSKNPCCGPGLEGIQSLRTAFTLNTALKRLFLSSTQLTSAGAICLAEFLPESTSLLHLDLTLNNLDLAGIMALSSGLKANHTLRCLDLNIPPGDEEFARMCRDILNSCVRNTEDAEKSAHGPDANGTLSGRGLGKGVWGMLEDSELAKSIRQENVTKGDPDIVTGARAFMDEMTSILARKSENVSGLSPPIAEKTSQDIKSQAEELSKALQRQAEKSSDLGSRNDLLELSDKINVTAAHLLSLSTSPPKSFPSGLRLQVGNRNASYFGVTAVNGDTADSPHGSPQNAIFSHEDEEDELTTTPRIDKGKGRAEPEPEEPEKVLSPTLIVNESEDEDEEPDGRRFMEHVGDVGIPSPTDRSRIWVAEEGEVFRRGNVLLGPAEMEGEFAGEELRKELLEAMVERPPPRSFVDDMEIANYPAEEPPTPPPDSPRKSSPRPYISRSRSSSSSVPGGDSSAPTSPLSPSKSPPLSPFSSVVRPFSTRVDERS